MKRNDPISHLMTRNVITVHHGDPISKVRALMQEHSVHHIPVVQGDQFVGIISWSDILRVSFGDTFQTDERTVDATLDHTFSIEQVMQKEASHCKRQAVCAKPLRSSWPIPSIPCRSFLAASWSAW
jgi:CBS domain-containing protein